MKPLNINPNENTSASQNARILAHLLAGGTVTALSALADFGCLRLASRISDLRAAGHPVKDAWTSTPATHKRVKVYFIDPETN